MRAVADTNIVVSGLLWHGPPRQVLDAARSGAIVLYTTREMLADLDDVLRCPKFAARLEQAAVTPDSLILGHAALTTLVPAASIGPVIAADPDDDEVLACAVSAQAEAIISGDPHLLQLGEYQGIRMLTAVQFLAELARSSAP